MEERLSEAPARAPSLSAAGGELLARVARGVATVTLNRPAALNAITLGMLEGLDAWLQDWRSDESVRLIVLRGEGDKAFCAGGDIRALHDSFKAGTGMHRHFFEVEYALDCRIHRYPKPIVSILDGIVMGGGMGISQGSALRIAGPRTRLAMPETAIGLFPDVGGSYFLSRAPGKLGLYLGLVGPTLGAADSLLAGLADAYLPADALAAIGPELACAAAAADPRGALADLARRRAGVPPEGELAQLRPAIDRHFGQDSVAAIVDSLAREESPEFAPWAQKTLALLARRSPTMLRVTFEQLRRGAGLGLADCFRMELNLVHGCFAQGDFAEGIRALIVDKDSNPRWNPPSLAQVTDGSVAAFFAPRWEASDHPLARL